MTQSHLPKGALDGCHIRADSMRSGARTHRSAGWLRHLRPPPQHADGGPDGRRMEAQAPPHRVGLNHPIERVTAG